MAQSDLDNIAYNKFTDGEITLTEYIKYQNRDKIMEKKEAMKILKDFRDKSALFSVRTALDTIIPELKESEDEKIRKELIKFVKVNIPNEERYIAWLEKQDNKSVNIDIESMVSSYKQRLKSQGGVENSPLVNMCLTAFRHGVENTLEELNLKKVAEQGEQPKEVTYTYKVETGNGNIKALVTEKVQLPKFKASQWIVHQGTDNIYQVVAIIDNQYQLKYGDNYTIQKCADVDRCARLWDVVKDAKDGDVLIDKSGSRECPFIFKETKPSDIKTDILNPLAVLGYCGIGGAGFTKSSGWGDTINCIYYPATKEQREQLKKAIADAGYTFDFEKKELKKIEQQPTWSEEDELMLLSVIQSLELTNGAAQIKIDWLKSLKRKIGQGLDPNDVIEWLKPYGCVVDDIVEQFKEDFGL